MPSAPGPGLILTPAGRGNKVVMNSMSLGLDEALKLTLDGIRPLAAEPAPLTESVDRVAAADLLALVDSPLMDSSRKDGYALIGADAAGATAGAPVRLKVLGVIAAGDATDLAVRPGTAVRVLTGARVPSGADTVVADEYVRPEGPEVLITTLTDTGKNILRKGGDVRRGQPILQAGRKITPAVAGFLAAAGYARVPVVRNPVVGILGTGDEIVEPGKPLGAGELYASNLVTLAGFCRKYRMEARTRVVRDEPEAMQKTMAELAAETDALITSGGAWRGDRDIVAEVLVSLGWQKVFHRIRVGPGKAVGFGMLDSKPVFILPGGPPSNLMGFLQIALPGLLALGGHVRPGLPRIKARLASDLGEGKTAWTDFFFGTLEPGDELPLFHPMPKRSRLEAISRATAVAAIPEGLERLPQGSLLSVQILD